MDKDDLFVVEYKGASICWERTVAHESSCRSHMQHGAGAEVSEKNQALVTQPPSEGSRRCHRVDEWEKRDICEKRRWWAEPVQLNSLCRFPLLCQQALNSGLE